ncbi:hypothetical protein [Streptomyces cinereoruber]|uniref:hypothetical protein n=1 Tax=Streptomyces cinereoruber TaxID=67260 RepID=UPI0036319ECC
MQIASVEARNDVVVIGVLGLPSQPAPAVLRAVPDRDGMRAADLGLHLVGGRTHWCPANTDTCTIREAGRSRGNLRGGPAAGGAGRPVWERRDVDQCAIPYGALREEPGRPPGRAGGFTP